MLRSTLDLYLRSVQGGRQIGGRLRFTESNKNTYLADFETCVFCGYLRNHLGYKKVIYIHLHPCLKSFRMKKYFLKSGHKIS